MLAGFSSTLLSAQHRLSSDAHLQFRVYHFPSISTKRLELPRSFLRKDASRTQPIRPVSLSTEKPIEKVHKSLTKKRYAEEVSRDDETCVSGAKRRKGDGNDGGLQVKESLNLGQQLRNGSYWFDASYEVHSSRSCSKEEEWVHFVPSDTITPHLPHLSNIRWFDSFLNEITNLQGKNVETGRDLPRQTSGSASTSSENLVLIPSDPADHETGDGSTPPSPHNRVRDVAKVQNNENNIRENDCIELVSLLMECVEQIGSKNIPILNHCLARLGDLASPSGRSPLHRLIAYYTKALALHVTKLWPHIFTITSTQELDRCDDESGIGWMLLNEVSPIPKFIQFTSNEILLRAFDGKDKIHIIDLDIKQGLQWPSLFQSLASRTDPPRHVRVTGICESKRELIETGERLSKFARALNMPFEFHPVVDRLEDLRLWMLHVKEGETVAINCAFQLHRVLYDTTGRTLNDFLSLIRSTKADVVVIAEQEAAHNDVTLDTRLSNSLKYYSAIFDSLDSSLTLESQIRIKVEQMFAREIRNVIACEGKEWFERHECFHTWKVLMEKGGFCCMGVSERELLQGEMLLKMFTLGDFKVEKEKDGSAITLSWSDQPLYTVSCWRPVDIAGSSSSQPL